MRFDRREKGRVEHGWARSTGLISIKNHAYSLFRLSGGLYGRTSRSAWCTQTPQPMQCSPDLGGKD
jgi:hypothetical protein